MNDKVNILLVDDQPAKLLSYQVILEPLNETLLQATSAAEAFHILLNTEVAVLLVDVCMPDLDGFQFTEMVRQHPRFEKTAIIFISAVHLSEVDSLKGYELGAVDYVPVPVVPEVLRAKVRVFADLYRKTAELARLNAELETRVRERTSALEEAMKRQEWLAREVDHRAKNALTVAQSLVRMTRADDMASFLAAINGRLRAMAQVHTLLSQSRWAGAALDRLVWEELAPFQSRDRASASGPSVVLRAPVAQAIALAIHELATNALKYGALSTNTGCVHVEWRTSDDAVDIDWVETGGPRLSGPPTHSGFGTKVIAASVNSHVSGEVVFDWRESGLVCRLHIPQAIETNASPSYANKRSRSETRPDPVRLKGLRVFVAEDEALIAMMIADILADAGATMVGPFASVAQALASKEPFDVALLDVHLSGETVYPVAEKLRSSGYPIVFATGYDRSEIDPAFSDIIVLQKPVEPATLLETLGRVVATAKAATAAPKNKRA